MGVRETVILMSTTPSPSEIAALRATFACAAMQGMLASVDESTRRRMDIFSAEATIANITKASVNLADALIKELYGTKS